MSQLFFFKAIWDGRELNAVVTTCYHLPIVVNDDQARLLDFQNWDGRNSPTMLDALLQVANHMTL